MPAKKNAQIPVGKPDSHNSVPSWERIIPNSTAKAWQPVLCSFQMYLFLSGIKLLWTCPRSGTPSLLFSKNSSYPNTQLSPLSLESQAHLGKTTVFCVIIKKQWSRQWRFLFSLNISFISEHKQPLSCSCLDAEEETHAILGWTVPLWEAAAASLQEPLSAAWFSYACDCPKLQARTCLQVPRTTKCEGMQNTQR